MWLTKQRAQPGNVFGHTDKFEGLGLFFDTYKNNRPGTVFPYIMAMQGDGNTPYDKDNDGKANELAGCSVRTTLHLEHVQSNSWLRPAESATPKSQRKRASPTSKNNSSASNCNTSQKTSGRNASKSPTIKSRLSHTSASAPKLVNSPTTTTSSPSSRSTYTRRIPEARPQPQGRARAARPLRR